MQLRKAERRKAKARVALSGPAGSGKTMSALLIAYGLTGDWSKICLVDTENGSGDLYANYSNDKNGITIGEYNVITLSAPYLPSKYIQSVKVAEEAGQEVIVVDSLTHAWAAEGGLLDQKGQIEKRTGNGWTAWRDITPQHNQLVEALLQSKAHIICTLRAKMDHVQEKTPEGKTVIRKIGLNPIQREGMEYEFTVFFDVDQDHVASSTKDRTSLFDSTYFKPTVQTGKQLFNWLEQGVEAPPPPQPTLAPASAPAASSPPPTAPLANEAQRKKLFAMCKQMNWNDDEIKRFVNENTGKTSSKELTQTEIQNLFVMLEEFTKAKVAV